MAATAIGFELRGADQAMRRLLRAADSVQRTTERTILRLTLEARGKLFQGLSGRPVRAGFWGVRSPAGHVFGVRSGDTRRRLSPGRVFTSGTVTTGTVGHPSQHVATLEEGGTMTTGGWFRIPTADAMTPAGVDRLTGRSAREDPTIFVRRSKAGNLWLVRRSGDVLQYLYLLRKSIRLPKKGLFAWTKKEMTPRALTEMHGAIQVVAREASR